LFTFLINFFISYKSKCPEEANILHLRIISHTPYRKWGFSKSTAPVIYGYIKIIFYIPFTHNSAQLARGFSSPKRSRKRYKSSYSHSAI
jgi:hypothetical protein